MHKPLAQFSAFVAVIGLVILTGCRATVAQPERDWRNAGFLGNYDRLQPDDTGLAQAAWAKPGLDLSGYSEILIEKVEVWLAADNREAVEDKDIAEMCRYASDSLNEHLGAKWDIVEQSGPGTLRIKWALTQLVANTKTGDLFTKVIPQTRTLGQIGYLATSDQLLSARVQIEAQLIDSANGEVVFAMLGARQGGNLITNAWSTWGEVKDAFDTWGENAIQRLESLGMKPTKK